MNRIRDKVLPVGLFILSMLLWIIAIYLLFQE